jgi:hypothetical protein
MMDTEKAIIFGTEKRNALLVQETEFLCISHKNHEGDFSW